MFCDKSPALVTHQLDCLYVRIPSLQHHFMPRDRIVGPDSQGPEEERYNYALRPRTFDQYIGQDALIRKLQIAV
jgi:hypothetical protein